MENNRNKNNANRIVRLSTRSLYLRLPLLEQERDQCWRFSHQSGVLSTTHQRSGREMLESPNDHVQ